AVARPAKSATAPGIGVGRVTSRGSPEVGDSSGYASGSPPVSGKSGPSGKAAAGPLADRLACSRSISKRSESSAVQGTVASGGSSNPATLSSFGGAMGARGIPASNRRRRSADRLGSVGGGKSAISTASRWESFDLNVEYQL